MDSRLARQDRLLSDILGRLDAISQKVAERPPALTAQPSQAPRTYAEQQGRATNEKVSEKELLALLNTRPLRSVELIEAFAITREHAARLLKDLFDRGLVVRNAEHKPFVYELTEEGKKAVSGS